MLLLVLPRRLPYSHELHRPQYSTEDVETTKLMKEQTRIKTMGFPQVKGFRQSAAAVHGSTGSTMLVAGSTVAGSTVVVGGGSTIGGVRGVGVTGGSSSTAKRNSGHGGELGILLLLHFMICHSKKCHRPRTSSCHKEWVGYRVGMKGLGLLVLPSLGMWTCG